MATARPGHFSIGRTSRGGLSGFQPSKIGPAGFESVSTPDGLRAPGGNRVRRFPATGIVSLLVHDIPRNDRDGMDIRYSARSGSLARQMLQVTWAVMFVVAAIIAYMARGSVFGSAPSAYLRQY